MAEPKDPPIKDSTSLPDNHGKKILNETRSTLLEHYSSKANNQSTIIFGFAVAFISIVQIVNGTPIEQYFPRTVWALVLDALILLTVRAMFRLVLWSEYSDKIKIVKEFSVHELEERYSGLPIALKAKIEYTDLSTLHEACNRYLVERGIMPLHPFVTNVKTFSKYWILSEGVLLILWVLHYFGIL